MLLILDWRLAQLTTDPNCIFILIYSWYFTLPSFLWQHLPMLLFWSDLAINLICVCPTQMRFENCICAGTFSQCFRPYSFKRPQDYIGQVSYWLESIMLAGVFTSLVSYCWFQVWLEWRELVYTFWLPFHARKSGRPLHGADDSGSTWLMLSFSGPFINS